MENRSANFLVKLPVSSFSFTMSTGIISISAIIHHEPLISSVLLLIGIASLFCIMFLYALKAATDHGTIIEEYHDNRRFFGFFTISAGIDVIATRLMLTDISTYDYAFFIISVIFLLTFTIMFLIKLVSKKLIFRRDKVYSDWLNLTVALEASAISMAVYYLETSPPPEIVYLFIFTLILMGLISYASINFIEGSNLVKPAREMEFNGMFFINMGAGAILSLASFELLMVPIHFPALINQQILDFLFAAGGIYATIWLPVVLFRYFSALFNIKGIRYRVSQWAIIFPLGMYSVTTHYLSEFFHFYGIFNVISYAAFVAAICAWAIECIIAARHIIRYWQAILEIEDIENPA